MPPAAIASRVISVVMWRADLETFEARRPA
jgi:hypothetical protein